MAKKLKKSMFLLILFIAIYIVMYKTVGVDIINVDAALKQTDDIVLTLCRTKSGSICIYYVLHNNGNLECYYALTNVINVDRPQTPIFKEIYQAKKIKISLEEYNNIISKAEKIKEDAKNITKGTSADAVNDILMINNNFYNITNLKINMKSSDAKKNAEDCITSIVQRANIENKKYLKLFKWENVNSNYKISFRFAVFDVILW